jgi:predicted RNA-binding Zn ribbon-like protein
VANISQRSSAAPPVEEIRLLGNHPCLDFVNTVDDRVHGFHDSLTDYASLVSWALRVDLIDSDDAEELRRLSEESGSQMVRSFRRAIRLRERLYSIFSAIAAGSDPATTDLDALQATFAAGMAQARLRHHGEGLAWSWRETRSSLDRISWGVARTALDLLFSDAVNRMKLCPGHDCGWLFLDLSRNRSRRWCSMDSCGSRAKMRTLYQRRRSRASLLG